MIYRIVAAATVVAVASAAPNHYARSLQTPVAGATSELCAACVGAEEALVSAITTHEGSLAHLVDLENAMSKASDAHSDAVTAQSDAEGKAMDHKTIVSNMISDCRSDEGANLPGSIMPRTTPLNSEAEKWLNQQGVVDAAKQHSAEMLAAKDAAAIAVKDQQDVVGTDAGAETKARGAADTACAAMRAGGYSTASPQYKQAKTASLHKKQYIENMYQKVKAERKARKMRR